MQAETETRLLNVCHDAATAESKKMAAHLVLLQRLFGHGSFRGPQASAILHWGIRKEDTVVVWRTGGGKTILFALTACLHPGLTVVVLPLISLINDMQRVLVKHNIRAAAMHSLMPKDRLLQTGDDLVRGRSFINVLLVDKFKNESEWGLSTNGVIVATSTLGMGVNVMGCRFTVHYHLPSSLTAYQQEAGRSSRDGEGGFSFILFSRADERLWAVVHSEGAREDICKMGRFSEADLRERTSRETVEAHRRLKEVVFAFTFKHACLRVILRLGASAVVSSPRLLGPCPAGTCSRCALPPTAASDVSLHARFVIAVIADRLAAGKPCTFSNVVDVACMSQHRDVLSLMANVPIYQATHPARSGRLTPALTASLAEYVTTALVVRGDVQMTVSVHEIVSSDRVDGDDDEVPTRRKIVFALSLHTSHAKPLSPLYYHA